MDLNNTAKCSILYTMLNDVIKFISLLMVVENLLPLINPQLWKKILLSLSEQNDNCIRIVSFIFIVSGLMLLKFFKI